MKVAEEPVRPTHSRTRSQSMPHPASQSGTKEPSPRNGEADAISSREDLGNVPEADDVSAGEATDESERVAHDAAEEREGD